MPKCLLTWMNPFPSLLNTKEVFGEGQPIRVRRHKKLDPKDNFQRVQTELMQPGTYYDPHKNGIFVIQDIGGSHYTPLYHEMP